MWITENIRADSSKKDITEGNVISVDKNGQVIQSAEEYRNPLQVFPFGIYSVFPVGQEIRMLPQSRVCVGCVQKTENLPTEVNEGEILIFAKGGAWIKLCANGEIHVKGKIIEKN